ncbi:MAG: ABC transporter ATP-binding protein [Clostridia bacterium]|nr:ABC transporter ATP-binding protein [Clostridia bacterium]
MVILEGKGLTKSFDGNKIIENVSLNLKKGEIVSLLGVSGVGKTTLFNLLSGLDVPDTGEVYLNGEAVTGMPGKVGYMQQSDLLLPFKTTLENVMIPLILKGVDKKEAKARAEAILTEFSLFESRSLYPGKLSGGMRQRAALARTFLTGCSVFLLDEPFSALDALTRGEMQRWFRNVIKEKGASGVFITHDVDEAILLSDRIYILSGEVGSITAEVQVELKERDAFESEFIELKKAILEKVK